MTIHMSEVQPGDILVMADNSALKVHGIQLLPFGEASTYEVYATPDDLCFAKKVEFLKSRMRRNMQHPHSNFFYFLEDGTRCQKDQLTSGSEKKHQLVGGSDIVKAYRLGEEVKFKSETTQISTEDPVLREAINIIESLLTPAVLENTVLRRRAYAEAFLKELKK